eukprot:2112439-Amphidinium_carterae.1
MWTVWTDTTVIPPSKGDEHAKVSACVVAHLQCCSNPSMASRLYPTDSVVLVKGNGLIHLQDSPAVLNQRGPLLKACSADCMRSKQDPAEVGSARGSPGRKGDLDKDQDSVHISIAESKSAAFGAACLLEYSLQGVSHETAYCHLFLSFIEGLG